MRIISGIRKGYPLHPPKDLELRPTKDNSKESLFNVLWNYYDFEDLKVLDLFAGTGNISLEFASREAKKVVAVEQNPKAVRFINEMSEKLEFYQLEAIGIDVLDYLHTVNETFDLIFADPPYDFDRKDEVLEKVFSRRLLNSKGMMVLEHFKQLDFDDHPNFREKRKYGKTAFSFFDYPEDRD